MLALVHAARQLSDPRTSAGTAVREALVAQGPLSPEGVELALRDHLEVDPSPSDLDKLVLAAGRARRVHVVLAANVFVGALRALAIAVAASPDVALRSSRREAVFARALVRAAGDMKGVGTIRLVDRVEPEPGDEVHLYGHDATLCEIATGLPAGVTVRPHGSGLGVAVVGASAVLADAAESLARDVVPFDQRGCLSPRIVVVEGSFERARSFGRVAAEALEALGVQVPVGRLDPAELAQRRRFVDTCLVAGGVTESAHGTVAVASRIVMPPVGRNVFVWPAGAREALDAIRPVASAVAALGFAGTLHDPLTASLRSLLSQARTSPLGWMQRPRLDGPVDLRVPGVMTPDEVVRRFG